MSSSYGRQLSPHRNRYAPSGRTSAGSFFTSSSYDPYPTSVLSNRETVRSNRDYVSGPRTSAERIEPSRVVPIRTRSPPRRAADDDYVRSRPRGATLEAPRIRRPTSMIVPSSPPRSSIPIITRPIERRPPSPVTKTRRERRDDDYEILPASSSTRRHHHRQSSLSTYQKSQMTRPPVSERRDEDDRDFGFEYTEAREPNHQEPSYRQRSRRDSYNSDRPTSVVYPEKHIPRSNRDPGPPVSTRGFDTSGRSDNLRHGHRARDEDWADRKSEVRNSSYHPKPPRAEIALHQPSNDGYTPYPEEDTRHRRLRRPGPEDDMLEPQSKPRKLAPENEILELRPKPRKIVPEDEDQEPRSKGRKPPLDEEILDMRTRDAPAEKLDREGDDRPRRHHHKRHHRHGRLDDYDNRKDRDRRVYDEPRDMLDTEDDGPAGDGLLVEAGIAGAAGAAAATGLAAEGARRHRHKESRDEDARPAKVSQNHLREPERERIDTSSVSSGLSGDTGLGEVANEEGRDDRRRRRKMEEEDEDRLYEEARLEERRAKEKAPLFVGPVEPILREQASYERRPETQAPRHHRSYRPRHHHSRTRDEGSYSESSYSSSSDSEDDKIKREPHVVTPPNEDKPTPPPVPKGILRKPREKFPEHPDTVREGVAPHKDAGKKDVPPNARWTKINRKLVNPEALEQDGIRFNEYVDYVIVLKAMDLEEIEKYTRKTQEIREKRRLMAAPENIKHEDSF